MRRHLVLAVLAVLTIGSIAALPFIPFEYSLDIMLPGDSPVQRTIRFLHDARFSDKVIISLENRGTADGLDTLIAAADALAHSFGPPLVTNVICDVAPMSMMGDILFFLRQSPHLLGEEDLAEIDAMLTREGVEKELRARYMQLLKPEGSFAADMIRADPLAISRFTAKKLHAFLASFEYEVDVEAGHLVSRDGRHVLMILETPISLTDTVGSVSLLAEIEDRLRALAPAIRASVICGHAHTVSNQKIIRADIRRTVACAAVAFFAFFFLCFRTLAAGLIFLSPVAAIVLSVSLSSIVLGKLSALIIGFGSVIAGISVDYGIHVYVAVRKMADRRAAVRRVTLPILVGALTTVSVFAAFIFSKIEGYRQLGVYSVLAICIAVFYAVCVLPWFFSSGRGVPGFLSRFSFNWQWWEGRRIPVLVVFFALLLGALAAACHVGLDSNVLQLDGTEHAIIENEREFQETWGTGDVDQAMCVVEAPVLPSAYQINDRLYEAIRRAHPDLPFRSLAAIWPGDAVRKANADRWVSFWKGEREARLRRLIADTGKAYAFADDAFEPFFENLYALQAPAEGNDNVILDRLQEQFVREAPHGYYIVSYFPDDAAGIQAVKDVIGQASDIFIVSRKSLALDMSAVILHEVAAIGAISVVLIVLSMTALLRRFSTTVIALVPAITGVIWLLGIMAVFGVPITIANLIAGPVVFGLCIDFGIFMVYAYRDQGEAGTVAAVTLSALSTVAGAGVLLCAEHPALYSIGITLVAGVSSGFVAAVVVVPLLCAMAVRGKKE